MLNTLTAFACIALLCRNHRTPVDMAPTMKEARAMATATSTGTSTKVWLAWSRINVTISVNNEYIFKSQKIYKIKF